MQMKCRRCAGPMFPDEEGERFCLMCGERTYDWLGGFLDRLLDAMERQALRESRRSYGLRVPRSTFERKLASEAWDLEFQTRDAERGARR
jgi:hypothetical protein